MNWFKSKQKRLNLALCKACQKVDIEGIKNALKAGADPSTLVKIGYSLKPAAYYAVDANATEALRLLLDTKKIGINDDRDHGYGTLLTYAARQQRTACTKFLLDNGADINLASSYGYTPLHWAAVKGHFETVRLLVDNGADLTALDEEGNTAAAKAEQHSNKGIAEFLREKMPKRPVPGALNPGWEMMSDNEICFVEDKKKIGYRFTTVFNFAAETYTRIAQNTATHQESHVMRFFDELPNRRVLEEAYNELCRLGAKPPSPFINKLTPGKGAA